MTAAKRRGGSWRGGVPDRFRPTASVTATSAVFFVLAADWLSKEWARQPNRGGQAVGSPAGIPLVLNTGTSFGFAADHPVVVAATAGGLTLLLLVVLVRTTPLPLKLALAVALGGAMGNLVDRASHGAVTDWVHLAWYGPSFNVADLAIRGGLGVACLVWIRGRRGTGLRNMGTHAVAADSR
ncbi:MAG: lipoprotein signal peptidase [Frankiales bacterium]|nr:lipoprotein signal peptidase [Frankiales bacterium]